MKLTYFGLYGRGEPSRMAMTHAKMAFEDHRITFAEWGPMKAAGAPYSLGLPVLEHEGTFMNQSVPILRYIGMATGAYPKDDPKLCWAADATIEDQSDMCKDVPMMVLFGDKAADEECLAKFTEIYTKYYAHAEKQLTGHGGKYLCGDKITIADFQIFGKIMSCAENTNHGNEVNAHVYAHLNKLVNNGDNPKFMAWIANMKAELADYLAARPAAKL